MKTTNTGFTLAEVAVALIIIGLLISGILKAQELVVQSKIKQVIADITSVSAAMYAYRDRYRALPGDDKGSGRWGLTPPSSAGNAPNSLVDLSQPMQSARSVLISTPKWRPV